MIFVNQGDPILHERAENTQDRRAGRPVSESVQFGPATKS